MSVDNQKINIPLLKEKQVSLTIKREDLIHPNISGNKFRKLHYNLKAAKQSGYETILTFGGAYSNHIAATAYAAKVQGLNTIGVIRGDELFSQWRQNPTLSLAHKHGMLFKFVSREAYRKKDLPEFKKTLEAEFGAGYWLPEGGTNDLAVKGCEEILQPGDAEFDVICCAVGTGGTLAGISNSAEEAQRIFGFPALIGNFLKEDIRKFAPRRNWQLQRDYHFGGYAKVTAELIEFVNDFYEMTQIPLDAVYTGKMIYGILDMIKNDGFAPNTNILAIHTGGLQGNEGMNQKLKQKNLPLIHY
ncbi:MAG: pyridoxal-phosphate dependent enzyme [Flavobacteriaceae bacterium]